MKTITDYSVFFNGIPVIIAIILVIGVGFITYYYYRDTIPPVSSLLRKTLAVFRFLALSLIIFLLLKPVVVLTYKITMQPGVAWLFDDSQSMLIKDNGEFRKDKINVIIGNVKNNPIFKKTVKAFLYSYSNDLQIINENDSLNFNGFATNIGDNLDYFSIIVEKDNIKHVILVGDGVFNSGKTPYRSAEKLGVPISTIGIGDTTPVVDLFIKSILTNKIAFKNSKIPVKVSVMGNGFKNKRIEVYLKKGKKTIAKKTVIIKENMLEQEVSFEITPDTVGLVRYRVVLPVLKNEKIARNNRSSFYINVLKDKIKILMIGGPPNNDFAFLKRNLEQNKNFNLSIFNGRINGSFYQRKFPHNFKDLNTHDLIILHDVPKRYLSQSDLLNIKKFIEQERKALWVFLGYQSKHKGGIEKSILSSIIPVSYKNSHKYVTKEYIPSINQLYSQHPVMTFDKDSDENRSIWRQLPPLQSLYISGKINKGTIVLAKHPFEKSADGKYAPVISLNTNVGKVLCFSGMPIWRWKFMTLGIDENITMQFDEYINNIVRWLTTKEDKKRFRVSTGKKVYKEGETVFFKAELYNQTYDPLEGALVKVNLKKDNFNREVILIESGEAGIYTGEISDIDAGNYKYYANAELNDKIIGKSYGKLFIDEFSLEFENIRMRDDVLMKISSRSGGQYYDMSNYENIFDIFNYKDEYKFEKKQYEVWNNLILMAIIISLLSVEWFMRKRKGML